MNQSNQVEMNKKIYNQFIQVIFNERKLDRLNEFVAVDYTLHDAPEGAPLGPEVYSHIISMFRQGFPDFEITLNEVISEGEWVSARSTLRGTHEGQFLGFAPTGRKIEMSSLTMVRIANEKVRESWVKNDVAGLMKRLSKTE